MDQSTRRSTLLLHNAGTWAGTFIRLDGQGREVERFGSRLEVVDRAGTIHADLTNTSTGVVRSMQFSEPPAEMQISPEGHWSLGPDRIGPWPWVCELCLVWGDRRRRIVVRHNSDGLESVVLVCEGRVGQADAAPTPPLQLQPQPHNGEQQRWSLAAPAAVQIITMAQRRSGQAEAVTLHWQPEPGLALVLARRYSEHGLLEGL
ncbi:MAG: DUF3598 family protein [Cyanobacteriota bacterium]|nr:DUF3598 family protein [Cyanobacteriota bacterium]